MVSVNACGDYFNQINQSGKTSLLYLVYYLPWILDYIHWGKVSLIQEYSQVLEVSATVISCLEVLYSKIVILCLGTSSHMTFHKNLMNQ